MSHFLYLAVFLDAPGHNNLVTKIRFYWEFPETHLLTLFNGFRAQLVIKKSQGRKCQGKNP